MAKYRVQRPQQEVRLRSWPAGRKAAMRLMIDRLERSLNEMRGPAIEESAARKFNDNIPFILDLSVAPGYRQFELNFSVPPGLNGPNRPDRQLLFYEIQHDSTPAFNNPTIIETPQTQVIIAGVGIGETRSFRARVVNTQFEASRWTPVITDTTARGQIIQTTIPNTGARVLGDVGEWNTIFSTTYDPTDGAVFVNVHLGCGAVPEDIGVFASNETDPVFTLRSGPAFVQFRWLLDGTVLGQRATMNARPPYTKTFTDNPDNDTLVPSALAFGTFMTPIFRPGNDPFELKLQAMKMPGSEWKGGENTGPLTTSDPLVTIQNGKIIEVLENF